MKKVLSIVTIAGLALSLSAGVLAQGAGPKGGLQEKGQQGAGKNQRRGPGMGMMRGKRAQELYAQLNLTADQKKKLEALQKSTQEKIRAAIGDRKPTGDARGQKMGDRQQMMQKIRPIMEAHQKGVKDILTAEQEKKLETLMKQAREKRQKQRQNGGGVAGKGGTAGKGGNKAKGDGL